MSLPDKADVCVRYIQVLRNISLRDREANNAKGGAVQDLSIEVSKGQSLLVVGHSGCGKSSLLRAIAGEALLSPHADKPLSPLLPSMLWHLAPAVLVLSPAFAPRLRLQGVQPACKIPRT